MYKAVQINSSNAFDDEELKKLYESSFPEDERLPYEEFVKLLDEMNIDFQSFYDGEQLVGMWVVSRLPRYNWGVFFAVTEKLRGKGIGQKLLTRMIEQFGKEEKPFIGDIESPLQADAPNLEIRKRRHAFYKRNGFKDSGLYYDYKGVSYTIITTSDRPFTQKDYDEIISFIRPSLKKINVNI